MSKFMDLSNQTFGNLTVKERCEDYIAPNGSHHTQWLCECKCGNLVKKTSCNLKRDINRGCKTCCTSHRSELFSKQNSMKTMGDVTYVQTNQGCEFMIDTEDWGKIKSYCWWKNNTGYINATEHYSSKNIQLHRLIMDVLDKPDIIIDHRNGNSLDNRKCNLRKCTKAQNDYNKRIQPYNTSGVTGVTWDKRANKWNASIGYRGKTIHLGTFINKQDAIDARKQGEDKYFGEFSYNNSRNT